MVLECLLSVEVLVDGTGNFISSDEAHITVQSSGLHEIIEIDIHHMYTTSRRFVPFSPLFIGSMTILPGDLVTFDLSSDIGTQNLNTFLYLFSRILMSL